MDYATYSPEDNKLRLYVGRVPRDEYLKLRAEGWTSTPKQACDFVATWTPERRDTALEYAGIIEDEDQGPEDRAADRAERFGEYRDKRLGETVGHADTFDAGPMVHGYQSASRGERAARRHDRIASRACDAWGKAEYWQRRTAGVIAHALHRSSPGVRMGRIKTIEAELRGLRSRWERTSEEMSERAKDWIAHFELRLAYENQMLEAQGGRAAFVEMEVGGWIGKHQIRKVNKSPATGRVVSVTLKQPGTRYNGNAPGFCLISYNVERLPADAYTPPTEADIAALAETKKAEKAAAPKKDPCPLINPTDADAERLQAMLNNQKQNALDEYRARNHYGPEFKPSTVCRITQATYSAASKGSYARAETRGLCRNGKLEPRASNLWSASEEKAKKERGPAVCQVRTTWGESNMATRVIVITDKPQKPFPAEVWETYNPVLAALVEASESFA